MIFDIQEVAGVTTLVLHGSLTGIGAITMLRQSVAELLSAGRKRLSIDTTRVSMIDLVCVGEIFHCAHRATLVGVEFSLVTNYFTDGHVEKRTHLLNTTIESCTGERDAIHGFDTDAESVEK